MLIQCPICFSENPDGTITCLACGSPLTSDVSSGASSTSVHHLPIGTLLGQGRYRIDKVLGEGGFGITYKGTYLSNSAPIAIKELWPERAARNNGKSISWPSSVTPKERQQQLSKFQLEAKYLSQCVHPNITKVYEWFEENNTAYLVMEFVAGKSLYQLLKEEGKLTEDKAKHYFIQTAEALKVIHANHFLHRDIKPDNILIDGQDKAVLIDFGATREFIAGQTREMSVTLTKGYAPLEQYSYRSRRLPATDFYALCASLYELLTGELPTEAVLRAQSEPLISPRQLRPNLSPQIERVILTGMNMKVEERFQTADELIDALNGIFASPALRRARELVKQGKLSDATQAYETCLMTDPADGEAAVELALVQIHLELIKAERAAQRAIQLQPNDGRGYGVLGLVHCQRENWFEADHHLQQAVRLSPSEAWIQANRGWALGKLGKWQDAKTVIQRAIQLDGNCTFSQGVKAWIEGNLQNWKETVRAAKPAIFKSKQVLSRNSQELRGWVYPYLLVALDKAVITKESNDVERCLQEFLTQVPDSAFAWGFKGWKEASQGEWANAQSSFQQAIRQAQVPAWVLTNLGVVYEQSNNLPAAIQTYRTYTQHYPNDAFAHFRLGTILAKQGQWQQAIAWLEKAIELEADYAEAHHNLGWALLNLKDEDGQIQDSRRMVTAYQRAVELYLQQRRSTLAQVIKQAFQTTGVSLD